MNRSKVLLIIMLTVLLLGLKSWPVGPNAKRENNSNIEENSKSAGSHAPIQIEGNDALTTFIEDEGLSGEGTSVSPYVIEDFIIDASTANGIEIRSTDAHLIIRNCTIEGGGQSYEGILLNNAENVNISNNLLNNNYHGIFLFFSSNHNTLSGNNAVNNEHGIWLLSSSYNTLSGNTASNNNDEGIRLDFSNNNFLTGNKMYGSGLWISHSYDNKIDTSNKVNDKSVRYYEDTLGVHLLGENDVGQVILINCDDSIIEGIYISETSIGITVSDSFNCSISENTIIDSNYGIWLVSSSNNTLSGNTASNNNKIGIWLVSSSNNTLWGNGASDNEWLGISLESSSNNTLWGNAANYNVRYGIRLVSSCNNILTGNTVNNNEYGIRLYSSSNNNILTENIASYNDEYGIWLVFSSNNNVFFINNIYSNILAQAFEDADCINNQWDNGTTGNYWGDGYLSTYPSATNDGTIWNIPYEISGEGGGIDHFPLVSAVIIPGTTATDDTTTETTMIEGTTDDTTPSTIHSWNVLLLLLSFITMLLLRRCEKKT